MYVMAGKVGTWKYGNAEHGNMGILECGAWEYENMGIWSMGIWEFRYLCKCDTVTWR